MSNTMSNKSHFNKRTQNQIIFLTSMLTTTGIKSQIGNSISGTSPMLAFESNLSSNIEEKHSHPGF